MIRVLWYACTIVMNMVTVVKQSGLEGQRGSPENKDNTTNIYTNETVEFDDNVSSDIRK